MDNLRSKIENYQAILTDYVRSLANEYNEALGSSKNYYAIIDREENHFQFLRMGWTDERFSFNVLIHLSINTETGNVWVQQNNTEILLDEELESIPNNHLVLGFLPKSIRAYSNFAVA